MRHGRMGPAAEQWKGTRVVAHKIIETRQYTEIVYYSDDGEEVARDVQHDDHLYDSGSPEELTDEEREDWL